VNRMLDTVMRERVGVRAAIAAAAALVAFAVPITTTGAQTPPASSPAPPWTTTRASTPAAPPEARRGVVVMGDGSTLTGAVTTVDDAGVSLKADGAPARVVRWTECLGVFFDGVEARGPVETGGSVAVLADGRRIPGRAEANASGMRWRQRWLGAIELPQSSVRWISFDGEAPATSIVDADVVRLRTGDRLEGFVSRLSDPLVIEPREAGSATHVPLSNVQSVAFVTAEVERDAARRRVWLEDGTVIDAETVELNGRDGSRGAGDEERGAEEVESGADREGDGVGGTGGASDVRLREIGMGHGSPLMVTRDAVSAISGDRRGEALARRPMRTMANEQSAALRYEITPVERLRWPRIRTSHRAATPSGQPPTPTGGAVAAPGDTTAEFDDGAWPLGLPAFAFDGPATLRIDVDRPAVLTARLVLPRDRRPRGDFEVVVRSGGRELVRRRFDAAQPMLDVSFEVVPPAVEFEIVDTGGGAVQDGLVIERGVLIPRAGP